MPPICIDIFRPSGGALSKSVVEACVMAGIWLVAAPHSTPFDGIGYFPPGRAPYPAAQLKSRDLRQEKQQGRQHGPKPEPPASRVNHQQPHQHIKAEGQTALESLGASHAEWP